MHPFRFGVHATNPDSAVSLGIFYVDDQKQNRWVLKFEDPRVLAEIESVFVTVEPQGGSARPTGLQTPLRLSQNEPQSSLNSRSRSRFS
jgi:hypothetical protein